MKLNNILSEKSLWIFGYGSLVWKPDFKYKRSKVGYIHGYKRRFWHGDNFHRGNDEMVSCFKNGCNAESLMLHNVIINNIGVLIHLMTKI